MYPEDVRRLHEASWTALVNPRIEPAQARAALAQAQVACRIGPARYPFAVALALARYRTGDNAGAMATLAEAESLARAAAIPLDPVSLAIRSMALWREGDRPAARKTLDQLAIAFEKNPHPPAALPPPTTTCAISRTRPGRWSPDQ